MNRARVRKWHPAFAVLVLFPLLLMAAPSPAAAQVSQPETVTCPDVPGYNPTFDLEARVSFNTFNGGYRANCWYQSVDKDESGNFLFSELILDAYWAPPDGDENVAQWITHGLEGVTSTYCSDIDEFIDGVGVTASTGVAVRATYKFREAHLPHEPAVGAAAANALREVVADLARSCQGAEIIPRESYFTPLPAYLAEPLSAVPGPVAADNPPPATQPPPATSVPAPSADATVTAPDTGPVSPPPSAEPSPTLRAVGFALLGLSILTLAWTLRRARRERRVRPAFDAARVAVIAATATGSAVVLSNTPAWAVVAGVLAGVVLGWVQGRYVRVRVAGTRAYETRTVVAVVAFAVGLLVSQGAGLLNRTGAIGIGVGVTFLSAATAAGVMAGRRRPLSAARAAGAAGGSFLVLLIGGGLLSITVVAVAQENPGEDERRLAIASQFTEAVSWENIEIVGGLYVNEAKPFATISVAPKLTEPPEPLTRTIDWVRTTADGNQFDYSMTETFTFSLNVDGACCSVGYDGEGSQTFRDTTTMIKASGTLGDFLSVADRPVVRFNAPRQDWGLPFGPTEQLQPGTDEPLCRRPVAEQPRGGEGAWDSFELDGQERDGGSPSFGMYTGCDIEGFDVAGAQAVLPALPAANAPERSTSRVDGCPVFQEAFNALYSPSMGDAPTDELQRLFMSPNIPACTQVLAIGEEGPGGVRSEMDYELATPDPETEARRRFSVAEALVDALPLHEIPNPCAVDANGIGLAPVGDGDTCLLQTFHKFGEGVIRIITDYESFDGPNVLVRGSFPWGNYSYRCHHCDADSPEVARIVTAMQDFGNTGLGNFGPDAEVVGSVGAPEDRVGDTTGVAEDVDQDLIDLLADDPEDPMERAAIAAAIGLLGSIGIAGIGAAEDRLDRRRGGSPVVDEYGNELHPNEDGLYPWDVDGEDTEWLSWKEIKERIEHAKGVAATREDEIAERIASGEKMVTDHTTELGKKGQKEAEAAAERMRKRAEEAARWAEWEERIKQRDAMDRRQDLLEADSIRKNSTWGWWAEVLDQYSEGVVEDWQSLGPELYDAFGNGIRATADALSDPENWRVAAEGTVDSIRDAILVTLGHPATRERVAADFASGAATAARVAATLLGAAAKDPDGAAAGVAKVLLGVENWEKVLDRDTRVSERLARVIWGIFETGGAVWGAGATAVKVADKVQDLARGADALADAGRAADRAADLVRSGDALADATRGADAASDAVRVADPDELAKLRAAAERRREAEASLRSFDEMVVNGELPPDAWVRNLPEGAVIDANWMHEVGYSQEQIDALRRVAREREVVIASRTTNMESMHWVRDGLAEAKPREIKAKTINHLDTYIGAAEAETGLVGYFRPKLPTDAQLLEQMNARRMAIGDPPLQQLPDGFRDVVRQRFDARLDEYHGLRDDMDELIATGKYVEEDGKIMAVVGDRHVPYAGDIDIVHVRNADGSHLSAQQYADVLRDLKASRAQIQHGAETDIISYYTDGLAVGSPEWSTKYDEAVDLIARLEEGHVTGREVVVSMGPDGVLRRGGSVTSLDQVKRL